MSTTPQQYSKMADDASPKSKAWINIPMAFLVGGGICVIGGILRMILMRFGMAEENAGTWSSIILVGLSAVCTGLGWYQKLAKHAGAGTLVPITGFSNAISSSAIEAKSEGFILGVGTKIFAIAGPVILYGCCASVIYGVIAYIIK